MSRWTSFLFGLVATALVFITLPRPPASAQVFPPTGGNVLTANGAITFVDTREKGGVGISLQGTWSATVQFEATIDGSNWQNLNCTPTNSTTAVTNATGTGVWQCSAAGTAAVRVRLSAFASGSVQVTFQTAQSKP